jgi:phage gp16-like protein
MAPSTKHQRQLIGIACGQLGIDKDIKADMLRERFGKESTTEISNVQAAVFLAELEKRGFRKVTKKRPASGPRPRRQGNMVRMASPGQKAKIAMLGSLIEWRLKDGLTRWLMQRYSIDRVRTAQQAYQIIEGLKKTFEHQMESRCGKDWMNREWGDPEIGRYIREHLEHQKRD